VRLLRCKTSLTSTKQIEVRKTSDETLYDVVQEHLCRMLAHYIVYLGSKISLQIPGSTERRVMEAAHRRWGKEGRYVWRTTELADDVNYMDSLHTIPELNEFAGTSIPYHQPPTFRNGHTGNLFGSQLETPDFQGQVAPASVPPSAILEGHYLDEGMQNEHSSTVWHSMHLYEFPQGLCG
jgi:hypothetical protein